MSPTCYPAKFGRSRSNGTSVIKETRLKKCPSCPALQGHRNRHGSIRHLRLPINVTYSNNGPIWYRFLDKGQFQSKITKIYPAPCI